MIPPRENPFRVDRVSALPYLGGDVPELVERFLKLGRAAIVGPHGVGKSTLLRAIGHTLSDAGHWVIRLGLPGSASASEKRAVIRGLRSAADGVVLLDGFEQFGWRQRRVVFRHARLLVTAHAPTWLPTLITISPTPAVLDAVVERLHPNASDEMKAFAHAAFVRHHGDIRATLFDLYDAAGCGPHVTTTAVASSLRSSEPA